MIKYDLFRTTDGTLHRANLGGGILDNTEVLCSVGWRKHKVLTAYDFYGGALKVELVARNIVFKDSLCSQ
ncbi:MAG: hypothetical protein [Bacteriophage sp.]|nr:MAG: hypothetical protein [Bacteriophage sp.]